MTRTRTVTMARDCRLLLLLAMVASVAHAQTPGTPVYACVQISGNALLKFQAIDEGGTCPDGQTRVLVLARRAVTFAASAPAIPTVNQVLFTATFLTGGITVGKADPLIVVVELDAMTDRRLYTIPQGLACVPLVDGQRAGDPLALAGPALDVDAAQARSSPYTLWSIVRQATVSAAGGHNLAMQCAARSAFDFQGAGRVTVLQRAGEN